MLQAFSYHAINVLHFFNGGQDDGDACCDGGDACRDEPADETVPSQHLP
jgi:hypothetical protein